MKKLVKKTKNAVGFVGRNWKVLAAGTVATVVIVQQGKSLVKMQEFMAEKGVLDEYFGDTNV